MRMNISIPDDLRNRMDAEDQTVNWSAVAAEAFERKLAEFITKRGTETMSEVISRLRASLKEHEGQEYKDGYGNGIAWAKDSAEADELRRLEAFRDRSGRDWDDIFTEANNGPYTPGEILVWKMRPNTDGSREDAREFFEDTWEDDEEKSAQFIKGWAEGAISVWEEVKNQL